MQKDTQNLRIELGILEPSGSNATHATFTTVITIIKSKVNEAAEK